MAADKIMLIRHGEKQEDFPEDPNIGRDGRPDPASLNSRGWSRARALIDFFHDPSAPGIATPHTIFAAKPDADSQRPMQTVSLLAQTLWPDEGERARRFNTNHGVDDLDGLFAEALAAEGPVLVCWEHKRIPPLAAKFDSAPAAPSNRPGHRFDVVWLFDRHKQAWAFSQTPENLLPDDLDKPIKYTSA